MTTIEERVTDALARLAEQLDVAGVDPLAAMPPSRSPAPSRHPGRAWWPFVAAAAAIVAVVGGLVALSGRDRPGSAVPATLPSGGSSTLPGSPDWAVAAADLGRRLPAIPGDTAGLQVGLGEDVLARFVEPTSAERASGATGPCLHIELEGVVDGATCSIVGPTGLLAITTDSDARYVAVAVNSVVTLGANGCDLVIGTSGDARIGACRVPATRDGVELSFGAPDGAHRLVIGGFPPASATVASTPEPGPDGAMTLPSASGMHVQWATNEPPGAGADQRRYATSGPQPETATYIRLTSYVNGAPADHDPGCMLGDESVTSETLADGAAVCLAPRGESEPFGRLAMNRWPDTILLEGNATDAELLAAADAVAADPVGGGFDIDATGLPAGVALTGTGASVSDFASSAADPTASSMASVSWSDQAGRSMFYVATPDDESFLPNLRLGFTAVTDTTVRGVPAFVRTLAEQPGYLGVVWREDGRTFQVGSQGLTLDELLGLVEQLRPATAADWSDMTDAATRATAPMVVSTTTIVTTTRPTG